MFDRFVVVDWSANSTPKVGRDSIWIATLDAHRSTLTNPATRVEAEQCLTDLVEATAGDRILVGVDFSLGYPHGTAAALELPGAPWSSTAAHLADTTVEGERNANNRFEVAAAMNERMSGAAAPFWGCPAAKAGKHLATTKPRTPGPVGEWRAVETHLRSCGHRPFSSWQLLGAGAVGGQSMLGIAMVVRLQHRFGTRLDVWPFTTGLRAPELRDGSVVIVEIWPSLLPSSRVPHTDVRDADQVRTTVEWLAALDAGGALGGTFAPDVPTDLREAVENEEGWIFGVMV